MLALQLSSFASMYLYSKASSNVLAVIFLRLYLSGDVELNPGPKHGQLTTQDMRAVQAVLWAARGRWYNIGLELGMSANDLEVIKEKHSNDPDQCLTQLLYCWLRISIPTPTWTLVVSALRSPTVGYLQLAIEIEEQLGSGSLTSAGIGDVPLHSQDETIYQLKQEMASVRKEKDIIIFELQSKIEQLKGQLLAVPIKEEVEEKPLALVPVKTEVKEEAVKVTKAELTSAQPTAGWELRGVEVCGEMTVVVHSSRPQQITWEEFGLKLHIDEGSLPAGIDQCILDIKASLAGQYEFPDNSYLVSAIFWFRCEPMCKFTKPVTVEMQHCARREKAKLTFVRAVCSQKQLPYIFKQLGGDFSSHSSYGVVDVNGFSGLAINQEGTNELNYLVNLLSLEVKGRHRIILEIFIVVIWNTNAHRTVMKSHDRFKDARLETDQPIVFESDQVEFQLSKPSTNWKIVNLNSPIVRKNDVNSFILKEPAWIPHSHHRAKFLGIASDAVCDLECNVDIIGAKQPHNKLTIDISPEGAVTNSQFTPPMSLPQKFNGNFAGTRLSQHHLQSLLQQLAEHIAKWKEIGFKLGFTDGELSTIQASPSLQTDGPKGYLRELLCQWFQWAPGDGRGSADFATLEGLKHALRQANLGATAHDLHV